MKFSVTKDKLLEALQQVQNVVSTRTTLPILSNVLLQAQGNEVHLTTTDLDPHGSDPVLGDLAPEQVRVRFPPSPTGNLHVGNVRSALFNWVFARHYGGTFVLRVEDTDAGRNLPESYQVLYDSLTWLGLIWDEGPGVGGPYAPYIQSERGEIYRDVVSRLLAGGHAYRCYCTREEIEAREAARARNSLRSQSLGGCRRPARYRIIQGLTRE